MFDLAAGYTHGNIKNHPFLDGNKRTGFVIGILFLELNGYRFTATEAETTPTIIKLAAGELGETIFADWLQLHCEKGRGPSLAE